MIRRIRKFVYKAGFRPKLGNPFHSPSLDMIYAAKKGFVHLKGTDFDGETDLVVGDKIMQFKNYRTDGFPDFNQIADEIMNPISVFGNPEMKVYKPHYLVTPRKHGRSAAMRDTIAHNMAYGKGTVAYVGPSMTIKERPNPWPIGTDAWHLWNLRGNSWGHAETHIKGRRSDEWVFMVYTAGSFHYDAQTVENDVRTVFEAIERGVGAPVEGIWTFLLDVPEELL
jgi:hypothetical protein